MGAVMCARLGKKEERKGNSRASDSRAPNKWFLGMYFCIILLAGNLGIFGWRIVGPATPTQIKMNYPTDGAGVEQIEVIRGISQKLPRSSQIWIIVVTPLAGRYYPQNAADVLVDGSWSAVAHFGQEGDVDVKFDVLVVLADKNAQNEFEAYIKTARDKSDYSGLLHLPEGTSIYERATVIRK